MPSISSAPVRPSLLMSRSASRLQRSAGFIGHSLLFAVTSLSTFAVLFIFYFIARDALPFFELEGFGDFFSETRWYPSREPASFGALSLFFGSGLVTIGAVLVAVPLGLCSAICLSDVLPFEVRQIIKPVIEILASIPSVAYGFFAMVVLAPQLQENGGAILQVMAWLSGLPIALLIALVLSDFLQLRLAPRSGTMVRLFFGLVVLAPLVGLVAMAGQAAGAVEISSGTNALNVSLILGVMALPTVVSVSEDALQSVGVDLRMASYGLGATRAETLVKTVIPAASSGILAAVLLGIMRAIGETMVVWMASGNAAQIPTPWYDLTQPVRTLTATIAGDMGEADHVTGSSRYHVLFALALCLLLFCFACNLASEWVIKRNRKKLKGE